MNVPNEKIQELLSRISAVVEPVQVILFGSAARGQNGPDSDLDVLVIVRDGEHRRHTRQALYLNLFGFGLAVDFVVATQTDITRYRSCESSVIAPALREGIVLHAA